MSFDDLEIRPKQAPLSHTSAPPDAAAGGRQGSSVWLLGLVAVGALVALFLWLPEPDVAAPPARSAPPAAAANTVDAAGTPAERSRVSATEPDRLAPFAAAQRAQQEQAAEAALAEFVEAQLQYRETLALEAFDPSAHAALLAQAAAGDEAFLAQDFNGARAAYAAAGKDLQALAETAEAALREHLKTGNEALSALDAVSAAAAFEAALAIAPEHTEASAGLERSGRVPEIRTRLRSARNAELAGDYDAALAELDVLAQLDNDIPELTPARERVQALVHQAQIRSRLSEGFAALEQREFSTARAAFRDVLKLDPGNDVAAGGLQQVSASTELSKIRQLENQGARQETAGDWQGAVFTYESALALDPNLSFARQGLRRVRTQQRLITGLEALVEAPQKLSSDTALADADALLAEARGVQDRGPVLDALVARAAELVERYRNPVPVRLVSDEATEVVLSTVGSLGAFREKQLQLRPGEYVLIGTRDGCQDVRRRILVRPDMAPVEIRCQDAL